MVGGTLLGCGESEQRIEVDFDVQYGQALFRCGGTYANAGVSSTSVEPLDIRFFVHDVAIVTKGDEMIPLNLDQDTGWQKDNVALLDFADDTGRCATGSPETSLKVSGTLAQEVDDIAAVVFNLGIPESLNHIDSARAPAPFSRGQVTL